MSLPAESAGCLGPASSLALAHACRLQLVHLSGLLPCAALNGGCATLCLNTLRYDGETCRRGPT